MLAKGFLSDLLDGQRRSEASPNRISPACAGSTRGVLDVTTVPVRSRGQALIPAQFWTWAGLAGSSGRGQGRGCPWNFGALECDGDYGSSAAAGFRGGPVSVVTWLYWASCPGRDIAGCG